MSFNLTISLALLSFIHFHHYLLFNQFHPLDEVQPHDPISVVDCGKFHSCHHGHLNVFVSSMHSTSSKSWIDSTHVIKFHSHSCIIECHPFHPMWELSSLSIFIQHINFIKLHPCDNFRTQWIWLHRHHEFDFIHQTHFHFMFHLCVQFHVYGQFHESHGFGGFDVCRLESFIQFVIFIFFMEFIQILDGEMAQFHPSAPNFIYMVQICSIIVINLRFGHMDQFPFIHVCSILSNFLSSMWCSFEIK